MSRNHNKNYFAAAYIRVSTENQTELSPSSQLKIIRKFADEKGYLIDEKFIFRDNGISGMLDTIACEPLWRHLINYRCGTGHSVSFVGNVHEGPHALNSRNTTRMRPGMVVTDEPGVYETDLVGIRIENELVCVHKADNQYGTFLGFEPLMFVPIATSPILPGVLDKDEIAWLNDYHRQVFAKLAPHLNDEERSWLAEKCAAIGC